MRDNHRNRLAFSVIELIVVIAVLGVVLAIALPALGRARERARALVSISHSKQLAQAIVNYSGDYRGYPPSPASDHRPVYFVFAGSSDWAQLLVVNNYLPILPLSPFYHRSSTSNYTMSCTVLTNPDYWNLNSHHFNPLHLRSPSRLDQVAYPSRKIVLHDASALQALSSGLYRGPRVIAGFVDGHAGATDEVQAGAYFGEHFFGQYEAQLGTYHIDDSDRAGQHTWNGVHGWDVEGG